MTNAPYIPQVGDRVSVEGVVAGFDRVSEPTVLVTFEGGGTWFLAADVTFISRPEKPLEVGETVRHKKFDCEGEILAVDGRLIWGNFGGEHWTADIDNLTRVAKP